MAGMAALELSIPELCGQLIVGGFDGTTLPEEVRRAIYRGHRAGVILFKRNLAEDPERALYEVAELNRRILEAAPPESPPFIAVDQEGGRVARLKGPFLPLPPMRRLGLEDDPALTLEVARELGRELHCLGFNLDFAPIFDVDSNPDNPIIGDRAFGRDPRTVMRHGVAFVRGLQAEGVLACAKHFPGHGDTPVDSHLDLPFVEHDKQRLNALELPPFRAASGAGVASMMTAHVVYRALDPGVPATFSHAICTTLLRDQIGFDGALFSDDLEMGAVMKHGSIEDGAVLAVEAGCDVLLVCRDLARQERAHAALVKKAEADTRFRDRCREAAARSLRLRRLSPPSPAPDSVAIRATIESEVALGLRERLAALPAHESSLPPLH